MSSGFVYLVGAGPGDPRLLTVRALELLRAAEVVAHDELIPPAILALAAADAELLPVGRRAGGGATTHRLHPAVLERARAGRHVVRLKCGDPLVFGRGGEEAEDLAAAGVGFEIVPGISAALGAAAYSGIPLTHRDCASRLCLETGHLAEAEAPHGDTVVLYMAGRRVAASLARLASAGWAPTTPAALIVAATHATQQVTVGTIADLAGRVGPGGGAPALLVVGEVVARRTPWWEHRPLAGRRVLVGRARPGRSRLAARLRALGAEVVEAPEITVVPREPAALDAALENVPSDAWIGFACAAGVAAVLDRRVIGGARIVAFGDDPARALARRGVAPAMQLDGLCRDAIAPLAAVLRAQPLVVVTGSDGRAGLLADLASLDVTAEALVAYRTAGRMPSLAGAPVDLIALPSSSAARHLLAAAPPGDVPVIAIGARTEAAARALGARRVVRAADDTVDAVVTRVIEELGAARAGREVA